MKKLVLALTALAASGGSALAADLPVYTKAPVKAEPTWSWTGFYIFGGAGGGVWDAKSNTAQIPPGTVTTRDQKLGGDGWFGTVGLGYDWQFNRSWVAGVFADGQFGSLNGSLWDATGATLVGSEKLQNSYAVGVRLGYLVAPNVLSYVNTGYSGSQWSGATLSTAGQTVNGAPQAFTSTTTPSFSRNGFFIGGGVENNLDIFGISAPGWFMKTEYRAAYYGRTTLQEAPFLLGVTPFNDTVTFKPLVQTVSTSLVYRFDSNGPAASKFAAAPTYTKAPVAAPGWTGFYAFGGAGGGLWDSQSTGTGNLAFGAINNNLVLPAGRDGGDGFFATLGFGYDWQFNRSWVAGIFADGQFGSISGTLIDPASLLLGNESLRNSFAAGARLGYLVAPNVLSYVNAGYTSSQWSGSTLTTGCIAVCGSTSTTTSSFSRNGWFVGGGVENSLNIFGITAPGWFMKTEYRAAYYDRLTLAEAPIPFGGATITDAVTFKPLVQTISTSLVYRFNSPVVARY